MSQYSLENVIDIKKTLNSRLYLNIDYQNGVFLSVE